MEFETTTEEVLREADFRVCMIMKLNVISFDNFAYMLTSSEKDSLFFSFNVCWGEGVQQGGGRKWRNSLRWLYAYCSPPLSSFQKLFHPFVVNHSQQP